VLFRSPTSTPRDRRVAQELAVLAQVDLAEFGQEIFSRASDLSGRSPREILTTDFKEFRINDLPFAIGYMETVKKRSVDEIRDDLLRQMSARRAERGYAALLFIVVDIVHNQTEIMIAGLEKEIAEALGEPIISAHSVLMPGVVSRKKQVVPALSRVTRQRKPGR